MVNPEGQARVKRAIRAEKQRRGWNNRQLATAANIPDVGSIGEFLDGNRWFGDANLEKIRLAYEWEPGTIAALLYGEPLPSSEDDELEQLINEMRHADAPTREAIRAILRITRPRADQ